MVFEWLPTKRVKLATANFFYNIRVVKRWVESVWWGVA